jgi:hypothetical protein
MIGVRRMLPPRSYIVKQYLWGQEYDRKPDPFKSWLFWFFVAACILGTIALSI